MLVNNLSSFTEQLNRKNADVHFNQAKRARHQHSIATEVHEESRFPAIPEVWTLFCHSGMALHRVFKECK